MPTYRYADVTLDTSKQKDVYRLLLLHKGRVVRPEAVGLDTFARYFEEGERPRGQVDARTLRLIKQALQDRVAVENGDLRSNLSRRWVQKS